MIRNPPRTGLRLLPCWIVATALACPSIGIGQTLAPDAVAAALRTGGHVIVMRHASSPQVPPAEAQANADNSSRERQLDETGRRTSREMGEAIRRLGIPVGEVLSSPTYRALETVRIAGLGEASPHPELGDSGASMQAQTDGKRGEWLRARAARVPATGRNTVIVTHSPNITEAFPDLSPRLADGEALVVRPDGKGNAPLVARIRIEQWKEMRAEPAGAAR